MTCRHIDAKRPFPSGVVLDVDRRSPNRPHLLAEAGTVGGASEGQDTCRRREHGGGGFGDAGALHIAPGAGPVFQGIDLGREVGAENIDKGNLRRRQARNLFGVVFSPGFP